VVVIGEAGSGGALAIAVGDMVAMLEHSYYSVISPEGCASILWKDASKREEASRALKFNSESLLEMKIVDHILKEPLGGAHHDPKVIYQEVKGYILEQIEVLKPYDPELLIERRYMKFRSMGQFLNTTAS
jgi:acetyl-CoA carboxylase carboxyl transferase subunit alpha